MELDLDLDLDNLEFQTASSLLESLSLDIMEDAINYQINGQSGSDQDFLTTVIRKFNIIINSVADPESLTGLKAEMSDWSNRLIEAITTKYNIGYNINCCNDSLESLSILESLYHTFILNRYEYVRVFLINYIDQNKTEIIQSLGLNAKGTDITSIAAKRKNIYKTNIPIIANLDEVINFILDSNVSSEEFLDMVDDGEVYVHDIHEYFETGTMIGNFVYDYISQELGGYSTQTSTDIRNAIRLHLIGGN